MPGFDYFLKQRVQNALHQSSPSRLPSVKQKMSHSVENVEDVLKSKPEQAGQGRLLEPLRTSHLRS